MPHQNPAQSQNPPPNHPHNSPEVCSLPCVPSSYPLGRLCTAGWGCSLAWWAQAFGAHKDVVALLFGGGWVRLGGRDLPGLRLTVVRYNLGAATSGPVRGRGMQVSWRPGLPCRLCAYQDRENADQEALDADKFGSPPSDPIIPQPPPPPCFQRAGCPIGSAPMLACHQSCHRTQLPLVHSPVPEGSKQCRPVRYSGGRASIFHTVHSPQGLG